MSEMIKIPKTKDGDTFKVADIEFIKFPMKDGKVAVVTKELIMRSDFGDNNNLAESKILKALQEKFLPKIIDAVGEENLLEFETDLTTLDGLKPYTPLKSKVSLPTFDFYRENVEIFDRYKIDDYFWLATPESAKPHDNPYWIVCVAPSGSILYISCIRSNIGVRPFLVFDSSIFASDDE